MTLDKDEIILYANSPGLSGSHPDTERKNIQI